MSRYDVYFLMEEKQLSLPLKTVRVSGKDLKPSTCMSSCFSCVVVVCSNKETPSSFQILLRYQQQTAQLSMNSHGTATSNWMKRVSRIFGHGVTSKFNNNELNLVCISTVLLIPFLCSLHFICLEGAGVGIVATQGTEHVVQRKGRCLLLLIRNSIFFFVRVHYHCSK